MSIAAKTGCTPQTLNGRVKKADIDGRPAGIPTEMTGKMKALERENRELRRANEALRKASAYLAMAELYRRLKRWKVLLTRIGMRTWSSRAATCCRSPHPPPTTPMPARSSAVASAPRRKLSSPGRPPVWQRENLCRFWRRIAAGLSGEEAGVEAGVSAPVRSRWL